LFGNSSVGKLEEGLWGRRVRHSRREGRAEGGGRGLVRHYGKLNRLGIVYSDEQGGSARKTRRSP
jgi:hypothetical protein